MADLKKSDDGRGMPDKAEGKAAEPQIHDLRLIPGGSLAAAKTPIGINAFEHDDLPGQAQGSHRNA